jgi:anaerobic selenocysteine-containing dehydrogenase
MEGPRSEVEVLASVARLLFGEVSRVDWKGLQDHCTVRRLIAKVVPGYEPIGAIDESRREFHVGGRIFHAPRFPTPSGKARFTAHPLPPLRGTDRQLRLMTVRSEGQFNTVVYEEEDVYRCQERRDVVLLNPTDIDRLGLRVDQRVTVRSAAGAMHRILVRAFDIRAGNALMYFPEANVLVPATTDPDSNTPAFKAVLVRLEAEGAADQKNGAHFGSNESRVPLRLLSE